MSSEVVLLNPPIVDFDRQTNLGGRAKHLPDVSNVLNYGLLSIASYLVRKGVGVRIIDLQNKQEYSCLQSLFKQEDPLIVGVSCISCLAYTSSLEIIREIKRQVPDAKIIIGGQHITSIGLKVFNDTNLVDYACLGDGEEVLYQLFMELKTGVTRTIPGLYRHQGKRAKMEEPPRQLDINALGFVDYKLFPKYREMFPQIEESRGCNFRCNFCSNRTNYAAYRVKNASILFEELQRITETYKTTEPKLVLLCSNFGMNPKVTREFIFQVKKSAVLHN